MLIFLLYNCGLELLDSLPEKLLKHPVIRSDIKKRKKKPSEILLDLAVHQAAFTSKDQFNKGRPDIAHQCILQFLFSSLIHPSVNQEPIKVQLVIHTIENKYFEVLPSWRPPVHYLRFRGLIEKLLKKRSLTVSTEDEIALNVGNVGQIIKNYKPSKILLFTSHANSKTLSLHEFADLISPYYTSDELFVCLIGGYQHGQIPVPISKQVKDSKVPIQEIALEGGRLASWKVLSLTLQAIEWKN